ncbi:hypothetical protein V5G67_13385, partial [Enterococcus faecalis]|uniref:hypothetical protein n=2 Tax=Enterococcus TaxID=1350 RepID=UPI0037A2AF68
IYYYLKGAIEMSNEVKKMISLTWILFLVSIVTMISIGITFKFWGLKGLLIPVFECSLIAYIGFKIEIIRRRINIKSYNELLNILHYDSLKSTTSPSRKNFFLEKNLLAFLISFVFFLLIISISFVIF